MYDSRYCLPFGVITNVFLPSYSILLMSSAPVRFSMNFASLECDRFAFVKSEVVLIPCCPDSSVAVNRSATIRTLVLYVISNAFYQNHDIRVSPVCNKLARIGQLRHFDPRYTYAAKYTTKLYLMRTHIHRHVVLCYTKSSSPPCPT